MRLPIAWLLLLTGLSACSTLPTIRHPKYSFPKEAYFGDPHRPFQSLGSVRARATYPTLDPDREENYLCKNYFNKAVADLVATAKRQGADAVVDVKSVVFLADGRVERYPSPECSDDGAEGEALAEGIAVKWKRPAASAVPAAASGQGSRAGNRPGSRDDASLPPESLPPTTVPESTKIPGAVKSDRKPAPKTPENEWSGEYLREKLGPPLWEPSPLPASGRARDVEKTGTASPADPLRSPQLR